MVDLKAVVAQVPVGGMACLRLGLIGGSLARAVVAGGKRTARVVGRVPLDAWAATAEWGWRQETACRLRAPSGVCWFPDAAAVDARSSSRPER